MKTRAGDHGERGAMSPARSQHHLRISCRPIAFDAVETRRFWMIASTAVGMLADIDEGRSDRTGLEEGQLRVAARQGDRTAEGGPGRALDPLRTLS